MQCMPCHGRAADVVCAYEFLPVGAFQAPCFRPIAAGTSVGVHRIVKGAALSSDECLTRSPVLERHLQSLALNLLCFTEKLIPWKLTT